MTATAQRTYDTPTSTGTLDIKIKILPHGEGLSLPRYATDLAAGCDVTAAIEAPIIMQPGDIAIIPTALCVALPRGYELQVRARSGLAAKNGIGLVNGIGTIDADYRGEIKVIMINHSREPFTIERGMRIAQFVIGTYTTVNWSLVDELDDTARGTGGLGSTGK